MGWKQVTSDSESQAQKMSFDMTVDIDAAASEETNTSSTPPDHLLFTREVGPVLYYVFFNLKISYLC